MDPVTVQVSIKWIPKQKIIGLSLRMTTFDDHKVVEHDVNQFQF